MRKVYLIASTAMALLLSPFAGNAQGENVSTDELKKLSMEELLDMEVTSVSKREEKLQEAASAIQVITCEDIKRYGATSIPEALRLATNLHVAQKNSHDWAISARGFNTELANKLLVLIDGRTVYTPLFSGVFWDRQDYLLEDIERIEVISGPGSTLWGSNAVNGVINIITKSAARTQGLYAEAGGGTQLKGIAGLRYGGMIGEKNSFRIYGRYTDRDDSVFPEGKAASDSWNFAQSGFRMESRLSEKNHVTVQGDYYDGNVHLSSGGKTDVSGGNILGRWVHTFSESSSLNVQLYYDRTSLAQPIPASWNSDSTLMISPAGKFRDDLDTYDLDLQHNFNLGKRNSIVWGLGYRRTNDEVENTPGVAFTPSTLNRNLYSLFLQDQLTILPKLYLTLGTKIEHNDYTGFEYSPSARLEYNARKQTWWAAVSRAVRIPSRIDRNFEVRSPGLSGFGIDKLLIGGKDFKSEVVIAYELGYRTQIGSKMSGSISTFYNVYDWIRSISESPPTTFPFYYENNLEGETYGLELEATWQIWKWWRFRGGYSLLKEDIRVKSGKKDFNNALNETADPENRFTLKSSMTFWQKLDFDLTLRWVDSFQHNRSGEAETVDAYTEMDARIAFQFSNRIELAICAQNLLHDQHTEYVISNRNLRAEIERSVYGKVIWRF